MRTKSRKAAGQRAWQLELPYGYVAMPCLHEWAMDRRGEMARSAVRCRSGLRLARAVLSGSLEHASGAASMRGDLLDLRRRPAEGRSALPEGGTGG